jgi:hypothetical protein
VNFRLTKISKDFYSFSVWEEQGAGGKLLLLYTGDEKKIKKHARELDYDVSLRFNVLKSDEYTLSHV